ncbi:hypothetical protein AVEN_33939-1 [Araneus ventricosus]|uniref:Uncharacterized protein n=1 Tax=Araneus ventricosus TaxID=182803 RepID=A0A4Y2K1J7_ARAVE|nr:hypothetical protein AVEN_33939-1 [Araneus ventricosus]
MLSSSLRAYSAKGWLSVSMGQGARTSTGSRAETRLHKSPITRIEIRIGIRLRIQSRLNLPSRVESPSPPLPESRLPNFNLKTPLTMPSEAWPKG